MARTTFPSFVLLLLLFGLASCGPSDDTDDPDAPRQPAESLLINAYWNFVPLSVAESLTSQVQQGVRSINDVALDGEGNCFYSADMDPPGRVFSVGQVNGLPGDADFNILILEAPRLTQPCGFLERSGTDVVTIEQMNPGANLNQTYGTTKFAVTLQAGNDTFTAVYLELVVTSHNPSNKTIVGHFDCLARNQTDAEDSALLVVRNASFLLHTD